MLAYNFKTANMVPNTPSDLKVMLVEDCDLSRRLMRCYFEESGLQVADFETGEAALSYLDKESFDVILLDLDLPGLSGFEVTKYLREQSRHRQVQVIGITASRRLEDYRRCYEFGMNDCISKPLYLKEVVKRVVSWAKTDTGPTEKAEHVMG